MTKKTHKHKFVWDMSDDNPIYEVERCRCGMVRIK